MAKAAKVQDVPGIVTTGAIYSPDHMKRTVKTFPISTHELDILGSYDKIAAFCFSVASACVSLVLPMFLQYVLDDKGDRKPMIWLFSTAGVILCVAFSSGGIWAFNTRRSTISKIMGECQEIAMS